MPRTLPPVHSPLALKALLRGLWSSARQTAAAAAEASLLQALRQRGMHGEVALTDSGTSALTLALELAARGGRVALPAYGCFDLATAVDASGLEFVLYDVDPITLTPFPGAIEATIAHGARTVVVAHLYGIPVDIPVLRDRLPAEVRIVDDAAQGVGASVRGTAVGALGDYGVLSFGRGKGLTGGSGGALRLLHAHESRQLSLPIARGSAWSALVTSTAQWLLSRPGLYALPRALPFLSLGETQYRRAHSPSRISPFALGVLSETISQVDAELAVRQRTAQRYREALSGVAVVSLPPDVEGAGWLRFPLLVAQEALPMARSERSARLGIMPGYPSALADLEGFGARRRNADTEFPGARLLASRLFTLPTHGALAKRDVEAVIARVTRFR